jgi:hypothetical protein
MSCSRRRFLATSAAVLAAPAIITSRKAHGGETIVGEGEYRYRMHHGWAQLPDRYTWQTTHNVAVDRDGLLYVIHEGNAELKDHPSIFVFDPAGRFVRAFGQQFQGGGHGIEVRQEGSEQFLYVCAYQQLKTFAKLSMTGEVIWQQWAPMESGRYAEGEAAHPEKVWGRDRFMPTNFAFLDDGGFLLADGYGAWVVHRYNKEGKWVSCFGGEGEGHGTFNTPHGIWIDRRRDPARIVVCDRAHDTVQLFDMDGKYLETLPGFGLPANIDTHGSLMVVPELKARVSILGPDNQVVARLGDDVERVTAKHEVAIRDDPKQWVDGKFVHPHDACFDAQGNLYVAEWVATGRVSKLERV